MTTDGESYLDFLAGSVKDLCPDEPVDVSVERALRDLSLRHAGGGRDLTRSIRVPFIKTPGLALAGFADNIPLGAVLHWGPAETQWITAQQPTWQALWQREPAAILVTDDSQPSQALARAAADAGVPILADTRTAADSRRRLQVFLDDVLAPAICLHGDLVVFCGLGILILGKSGIGKSDCALDLIAHGHQLVADDVVQVRRNGIGQLVGRSKGLVRHHMDIRGLGIINVSELFSVYAVLDEYTVDLIIHLEPWQEGRAYNFQQEESFDLLGVNKPLVRLPVGMGRNWENLIQVAVRRFILRRRGFDAESALADKLDRMLDDRDSD